MGPNQREAKRVFFSNYPAMSMTMRDEPKFELLWPKVRGASTPKRPGQKIVKAG